MIQHELTFFVSFGWYVLEDLRSKVMFIVDYSVIKIILRFYQNNDILRDMKDNTENTK